MNSPSKKTQEFGCWGRDLVRSLGSVWTLILTRILGGRGLLEPAAGSGDKPASAITPPGWPPSTTSSLNCDVRHRRRPRVGEGGQGRRRAGRATRTPKGGPPPSGEPPGARRWQGRPGPARRTRHG